MADRMDQVVAAAVRQGFAVRQTRNGTWIFYKGITTLIFQHTPRSPREWMWMINALRGAGLRLPPRE